VTETAVHPTHHALPAPAKGVSRKGTTQKTTEVSPDMVIPMDDDFKDF
jgi:hypothetical protein